MADPKKIQEYQKVIADLQKQGCNTAPKLLLALLRHYVSKPADTDNPFKSFGLFILKSAHSRTYQKYIEVQIEKLAALGDKPLSEFLATIDSDISSEDSRKKNEITKPHKSDGHLHSLLVALFMPHPEAFNAELANPGVCQQRCRL